MISKFLPRQSKYYFHTLVTLPTILAAIYYAFFASDIYISESRFVVKAQGQKSAPISTLANLIQTTGLSAGQEQANEILDYIRSRTALNDLRRKINVRAAYSRGEADFLSRFPQPFRSDTFENLFKYYGSMVSTSMDHDTGSAVLTVKAYTAKDAHDLNAGLLVLSEALVNRLNERARQKAVGEAERRVVSAQERLAAARVSLRQYRNSQDLLDPAKQAVGVLEIANKLIAERAALRAQVQVMQQAAPNNPSLPAMRARIRAIDGQIGVQEGQAVGTEGGIASKLGGYEKLFLEQELSTQMLTAATATLEQAQNEAQKQQFYLERVVDPNTPDLALLPRRIWSTLTVAASCLCIYFVSWMLVVGILEHAPED